MIAKYAKVPKRATTGSAGYDFHAPKEYILTPWAWTTIETGIRLSDYDQVKDMNRWFMMIVPRSGLSFKYGLRIINTVAIIDQDYRGEIKLKIKVSKPYFLRKGERFAQGIILPYGVFDNENVPDAERNGGFGSTGE